MLAVVILTLNVFVYAFDLSLSLQGIFFRLLCTATMTAQLSKALENLNYWKKYRNPQSIDWNENRFQAFLNVNDVYPTNINNPPAPPDFPGYIRRPGVKKM